MTDANIVSDIRTAEAALKIVTTAIICPLH